MRGLWKSAAAVGCSEERLSIRESLRIFSRIETLLKVKNSGSGGAAVFESAILDNQSIFGPTTPVVSDHTLPLTHTHTSTPMRIERSCGATNKAFASLFFSRQQLTQTNSVEELVNGSQLQQIGGNLNIFMWGLRDTSWLTSLGKIFGIPDIQCTVHESSLFPFLASRNVTALRDSLVRPDATGELPRVFFCNATWVLYDRDVRQRLSHLHKQESQQLRRQRQRQRPAGRSHSHTPAKSKEVVRAENNSATAPAVPLAAATGAAEETDAVTALSVKDHQWAVIKHDNDHFQIVQGYIAKPGRGNHSNRLVVGLAGGRDAVMSMSMNSAIRSASEDGGTNTAAGGYFLSEWQNQPQCIRPAPASAIPPPFSSGSTGQGRVQDQIPYLPHLDAHGGRYSSSAGFDLREMLCFLDGVGTFAVAAPAGADAVNTSGDNRSSPSSDATAAAGQQTPAPLPAAATPAPDGFDSALFKSLFGVYERSSRGRNYSPGFSFRELADSSIEGSGERHCGDKIEKEIDDRE